jgi:hypothetical protein
VEETLLLVMLTAEVVVVRVECEVLLRELAAVVHLKLHYL